MEKGPVRMKIRTGPMYLPNERGPLTAPLATRPEHQLHLAVSGYFRKVPVSVRVGDLKPFNIPGTTVTCEVLELAQDILAADRHRLSATMFEDRPYVHRDIPLSGKVKPGAVAPGCVKRTLRTAERAHAP